MKGKVLLRVQTYVVQLPVKMSKISGTGTDESTDVIKHVNTVHLLL